MADIQTVVMEICGGEKGAQLKTVMAVIFRSEGRSFTSNCLIIQQIQFQKLFINIYLSNITNSQNNFHEMKTNPVAIRTGGSD